MAAARCMLGFIPVIFHCQMTVQVYSAIRSITSSEEALRRTLKSQQTCQMHFKYQRQFLFVCFHSGCVQRHTACAQLFKKHSHLHGASLRNRELSDIAAGPLVTPSGRGGTKCCVSEQLAAVRSPFCSSGQKC